MFHKNLTPDVVAAYQTADLDSACQITGGRYFWPLQPKHPLNDYDIEFIAHSLSTKIRWAGVMSDENGDPIYYSVAQHSVHVADLVNLGRRKLVPGWDWDNNPAPTFYGLMHDASEAFLEDVPRPIKGRLTNYYDIEAALMAEILDQFNVPTDMAIKEAVRRVDNAMIFLERDKLVGKPIVPYSNELDHPRTTIDRVIPEFRVMNAKEAKQAFLEKFAEVVTWDGNHVPLQYANRGYGF